MTDKTIMTTAMDGGSVDHAGAIIDQLDIWTSTIKKRGSQGRGSSKKIELYGIKKLRELILDLAVRGLLVPQDPNDEPASMLLEKNAAEKELLVKEGKIKKQKPLPQIREDEEPFELPNCWEWCRLPDVGDLARGKSKHRPRNDPALYVHGEFPLVQTGDVSRSNGLIETYTAMYNETGLAQSKLWPKGTMCITIAANIADTGILGFDACFPDSVVGYIPHLRDVDVRYFDYFIRTAKNHLEKFAPSTAQKNINLEILSALLVPCPPEAEQHRIVAKVDELMVLCDQLEQQQENSIKAHQTLVETLLSSVTNAPGNLALTAKDGGNTKSAGAVSGAAQAWTRIADNFDTLFTTEHSIDQLKQTILQLAVMGKLVPQEPTDEPASVLLKKIAAEKEQLIIDGKIKKQKALLPISEVEKPFDLPVGWEFERIGMFGVVGTGSTPSRANPEYWHPAEFNWVSSGETSELFVDATKEKVSALALKETNVSLYPPGTLIVAMYGQGKTRGQITELLREAGTNQACAAIRLIQDSKQHKNYVKLYFRKAYDELRKQAAGGAQPNLNVGKISNTILALPPIEEQHRIVTTVDELMVICDNLKAKINSAQTTQLHLTDAISEQAINKPRN